MSNDFDALYVKTNRYTLDTAREDKALIITASNIRVTASSASALATLKFNANERDPVNIFNGRRFKNWPVTKLFLSHTAQAGEWIELEYWASPIMGPPEIEDDALIAQINGAIAVGSLPDVMKARTLAGKEFLFGYTQGSAASNYAHLGIVAAAGKRVTVHTLRAQSDGAGSVVELALYDTALTEIGAVPNRLAGGAASSSKLTRTFHTALYGTMIDRHINGPDAGYYEHEILRPGIDAPIVLAAGKGLVIAAATTNKFLKGTFGFTEEDV